MGPVSGLTNCWRSDVTWWKPGESVPLPELAWNFNPDSFWSIRNEHMSILTWSRLVQVCNILIDKPSVIGLSNNLGILCPIRMALNI